MQELLAADAADASSDDEDDEPTISSRFWTRRAVYLSYREKLDITPNGGDKGERKSFHAPRQARKSIVFY